MGGHAQARHHEHSAHCQTPLPLCSRRARRHPSLARTGRPCAHAVNRYEMDKITRKQHDPDLLATEGIVSAIAKESALTTGGGVELDPIVAKRERLASFDFGMSRRLSSKGDLPLGLGQPTDAKRSPPFFHLCYTGQPQKEPTDGDLGTHQGNIRSGS